MVADEVRNLARRSTEAARETTELLTGGDRASAGQRGVVEGLALIRENASRVANQFATITSKIKETDSRASQIANASAEQARGLELIGTALHKIDQVTQSNAASSEEAAASAENLRSHAEELTASVRRLEAALGVRVS